MVWVVGWDLGAGSEWQLMRGLMLLNPNRFSCCQKGSGPPESALCRLLGGKNICCRDINGMLKVGVI